MSVDCCDNIVQRIAEALADDDAAPFDYGSWAEETRTLMRGADGDLGNEDYYTSHTYSVDDSLAYGWGIDTEEAARRDVLDSNEVAMFAFEATPGHLRAKALSQAQCGGDRLPRRPRAQGSDAGVVILQGYFLTHEGDTEFVWESNIRF
jgi:hypothetical protein